MNVNIESWAQWCSWGSGGLKLGFPAKCLAHSSAERVGFPWFEHGFRFIEG